MSQLETNTVSLQTLLDKVNALPDAGSGGGGAQVATGTFTLTATTKANKKVAEVSGLGFRPRIIACYYDGQEEAGKINAISYTNSSNYIMVAAFIREDGIQVIHRGTRNSTAGSSTDAYTFTEGLFTITDDGFTLYTPNLTYIRTLAVKFRYVAIS